MLILNKLQNMLHMQLILIFITTFIFLVISILHYYWAIGGTWGMRVAVPMRPTGEPLFVPSVLASLVVATGLLGLALVVVSNAGVWDSWLDGRYTRWATLAIAGIFALRGVGDFHWVGLFKRVHGTPFANWDTAYYTPLCLLISVLCLGIVWAY